MFQTQADFTQHYDDQPGFLQQDDIDEGKVSPAMMLADFFYKRLFYQTVTFRFECPDGTQTEMDPITLYDDVLDDTGPVLPLTDAFTRRIWNYDVLTGIFCEQGSSMRLYTIDVDVTHVTHDKGSHHVVLTVMTAEPSLDIPEAASVNYADVQRGVLDQTREGEGYVAPLKDSLSHISALTGVPVSTLSQLVSGKRPLKNLSWRTVFLLSRYGLTRRLDREMYRAMIGETRPRLFEGDAETTEDEASASKASTMPNALGTQREMTATLTNRHVYRSAPGDSESMTREYQALVKQVVEDKPKVIEFHREMTDEKKHRIGWAVRNRVESIALVESDKEVSSYQITGSTSSECFSLLTLVTGLTYILPMRGVEATGHWQTARNKQHLFRVTDAIDKATGQVVEQVMCHPDHIVSITSYER